jgi:hypothetical protein
MKKYGVLLLLLVAISCLSVPTLWARDWEKFPAGIEIKRAERVAVLGDVHGAFPQFAKSLECLGVIAPVASGTFDVTWTGGKTLLMCMGDLGDRGEYSKEVFDAVMSLQEQAPKTGGRVICLMGNHEFYTIAGIVEDRARNDRSYEAPRTAIDTVRSFEKAGINYYQAISAKGKYGAWIRNLPIYAIVNKILFIHAGPSFNFSSPKKVVKAFKQGVESGRYMYDKGVFKRTYGPLMTRGWWELNDKNYAKEDDFCFEQLEKWKVNGIVFGHTPNAFSSSGYVGAKFQKFISVDIGMTPYYRDCEQGGGLLLSITPTGKLNFTAKYPDRPDHFLFEHEFDKQNPARTPVSDVTSTSVQVNIGVAKERAQVCLVVSDFKKDPIRTEPKEITETSKVASFKVEGLEPNTQYFYRVEIDGSYEPGLKGSFKTLQ